MAKLLLALLVAWAGWWLWRGPRRLARPVPAPGTIDAEAEALALLELPAGADAAAVRAAHRRLIAAAHPDRGGSTEQTRRLNVARDILLQRGN
jgi:DnaJ homolog subfamily C member 19